MCLTNNVSVNCGFPPQGIQSLTTWCTTDEWFEGTLTAPLSSHKWQIARRSALTILIYLLLQTKYQKYEILWDDDYLANGPFKLIWCFVAAAIWRPRCRSSHPSKPGTFGPRSAWVASCTQETGNKEEREVVRFGNNSCPTFLRRDSSSQSGRLQVWSWPFLRGGQALASKTNLSRKSTFRWISPNNC